VKGDKGDPGAKGDQGDPGLKGDKGDKGDPGTPGATNVTVRFHQGALQMLGYESTTADVTSSCDAGERAVGGGGETTNGHFALVRSQPTPNGGTPTGWTVTFTQTNRTGDLIDIHKEVVIVTAYAVCASP
jgi:hypothetical protein